MMVMVKNSDIQVIYVVVVLFLTLFLGQGTEASPEKPNFTNDLTQNYYSKHNKFVCFYIPQTEEKNNSQIPNEITCPQDIYTYTDINSCSSYISGNLNVQFPENSLTRLSWEMTGATTDSSEKNGINQINDYTFNEGETTVTYTLEDKNSNVTTCSFTVTIWDNQVPRLENMPEDITVSAAPGECSATVYWREPTAGDNCSSASEIVKEASVIPGSIFPVGKTAVHYYAYDAMGNQSARQSFTITVQDNEAPQILLPEEITINCEDETPAPWQTFQQLTAAGGYAADNCELDESSFRLLAESSDKEICPFTITRTYEISDIHGNKTTAAYLIHVAATEQQTQEPVLKSTQATIVSTATGGDWNNGSSWVGGNVPQSGDDVKIVAGATITLHGNQACSDILINGTLTVTGNYTLQVNGSWTNNGTFNAGTGTIAFTGSSDAVLSGSSTSDFKNLILNKGTTLSPTLVVASSISASNITFSNGTLKLNSGTTNIVHGFDIPSSAGIWVNGATLNTGDFSVDNNGLIRISSGIANFGNSKGNTIHTQIDGAFEVTGGVVNIAGRLENTAGGPLVSGISPGIHISGGTITLATFGNGLSNVGSLNVTSNGTFDFSGGTIVFQNPSTGATELDLGLISGSGTKNTVGGTFRFGNTSTPAGADFNISSDILLDNITSSANINLSLNSNLLANQLSLGNGIDLNGNALRLSATATKTYNFPLNDGNGNLIPVSVTLTSGSSFGAGDYIEVLTTAIKHPNNANTNNYLKRYWQVSTSGVSNPSYDITTTFAHSDIVGSDAEIAMGSWSGSLPWTKFGNANTSANTITATGISGSNPVTFSGITSDPPAVEINGGNATESICYGSAVNLSTTVTGDPGFSYVWNPTTDLDISDPANPVASPTSTITYTVTVTDGNGFTSSAAITVDVNPLPTANISGSASICENDTYTLGAGEATYSNGTIQWTEDGAGSISAGGTTPTPTYTPAAADAGNTVTLTMTVTGLGACSTETATATYTIDVHPLPAASTSGSATICENETYTLGTGEAAYSNGTIQWTEDGAGSISAGGTTLTPTYTPAAADAGNTVTLTMTVTGLGACSTETATATYSIDVNPLPTATISGDNTICEGEVATLSVNLSGTPPWSLTYQVNGANDVTKNGINSNPYTFDVSEAGIYTISALSDANCTGTTFNGSATIVVDPISEGGTIDGETTVCSGTNSTTLTLSGYVGTIQKWQASTDGTNWIDISNTNNTYTATNLTQTTSYRAVVKSGVCSESFSDEVTITVNPVPTVAAPEDKFYCMGETTFVIPLTSTPEGAVYDISGGAAIGLSDKTGVTQIPAYTAMPGNAVIQITPRLNGCTGDPVTYNVTVNPRPNIKLSQSTETIGSGGSTGVSFSSTTDDVSFSWDIFSINGGVTGTSPGSGDQLVQTLYNNSGTTGSVIYQITATSPYCEGATINYTVYVHPEIQATISGDNEVCQNDASPEITFTASGGTGPYTFTYTINGGDYQYITTTSGNTVTVPVPTDVPDTYNYDLISVVGAAGWEYAQTGTAIVTVKPLPYLTSSLTPPGICNNDAFLYEPTSNLSDVTFEWSRQEVSGISNPENSGTDNPEEYLENTTTDPIAVTYTYTLTSSDGCVNTQDVIVLVTPVPHLTSPTSDLVICSGEAFSYTPTSDVSGTNFPWTRAAVAGISNPASSGTGNPNEVLINTTTSPVGVEYIYTLESNDCENPVTYSVPVVIMPAPDVTASASEYYICPGESVDLFSSSNIGGGASSTTLLSESFNSASTGATSGPNGWTTAKNNNSARWKVRQDGYDYTYGNKHNRKHNVFHSNDNSKFYLANSHAAGNTNVNSRLTSPAINTTGYTDLELSFWHYYRSGGNSDHAEVRVSTNGSSWTEIKEFYNNEGGITNFENYTYDLSAYVGQSTLYIQFRYRGNDDYWWAIDNVSITGTPASSADILWTSNTSSWTSTEANPTNVYPPETTTYTATYTDPDNGCNGSASVTVNVYPQPEPTIHADYCVVAPKIRLTASSGYDSYDWQPLPYGETNGKNYVDIDIAGIYTVNVTDEHGCPGAASINVSNEYVTNGSFEMGNVGFTTPAAANGNQYTYVVDGSGYELYPEGLYGIGTNGRNYHGNFWGVDHTTGTGNFMIVNGFPGAPQPIVWQQEITNLQPNTTYYLSAWAMSLNSAGNDAKLRFSINGTQLGTIADLTTIPGVSNSSNSWHDEGRFWATWNSGSNTSATLAIVDLQTAAGGNDFGLDDISFGILDPSPAEIAPSSANDACSGGTIELFANVTGGKEPITYSWVGPNGHTSTEQNPVFEDVDETYDGIYTLTVTDWYGCDIPSETVDVKVYPQAIVDAGDDQSYGCSANTAFQLNGTISGAATSCTWTTSGSGTFDDPTKPDAIYTYSAEDIAAGTVTLTLTTNDPEGPCPAASDQTVLTINPSPELDVTIDHPLCYGFTTGSALATVSNGTPEYSYSWSNGQTTEEATGLAVGSYEVTVTDANGCYDTETIEIVEPEPLVVYPPSFTPPTCYGGDDGTATVNVEGGTLPYVFTWDAATGNQTTQTATGLTVGTYLFTVTDVNGCNITSDFVLVTQPEPPTLTCPPNPDTVYAAIGEITAPVTLEDPVYDAVCQDISWTMDGATVVSAPVDGIVPSPYVFNAGTTEVTYTTVDKATGTISSCTFEVVVVPNDPPGITCIDPEPVSATTGLCSVELNIDLPVVNAGSDITWEWVMTGATEDSGTDAVTPNPHTFNPGITTITWTATNLAGTDVCTQTITVTDDQNPTFTTAPIENCVDMLYSAVYTASSPNPIEGVDPNLIKSPSPDYYTFKAGDTSLDITDLADNCCATEDMTIHWQIDFEDTPDPLNPTGPELTHASVSGTGQPSEYVDPVSGNPADIYMWGDGVYFTTVTHTIRYWVEDCNGNISDEQEESIVITPRPKITKMN